MTPPHTAKPSANGVKPAALPRRPRRCALPGGTSSSGLSDRQLRSGPPTGSDEVSIRPHTLTFSTYFGDGTAPPRSENRSGACADARFNCSKMGRKRTVGTGHPLIGLDFLPVAGRSPSIENCTVAPPSWRRAMELSQDRRWIVWTARPSERASSYAVCVRAAHAQPRSFRLTGTTTGVGAAYEIAVTGV
jgi:hypothetical protein